MCPPHTSALARRWATSSFTDHSPGRGSGQQAVRGELRGERADPRRRRGQELDDVRGSAVAWPSGRRRPGRPARSRSPLPGAGPRPGPARSWRPARWFSSRRRPCGAWVWGSTATASRSAGLAATTWGVSAVMRIEAWRPSCGQPSSTTGALSAVQVASRPAGMGRRARRSKSPRTNSGSAADSRLLGCTASAGIATSMGATNQGWMPRPPGIGSVDRFERVSSRISVLPRTTMAWLTSYSHGHSSPPARTRRVPAVSVSPASVCHADRYTWPWMADPSEKFGAERHLA